MHPIGFFGFNSPRIQALALMVIQFNPDVTIFTDGPEPTEEALADGLKTLRARGIKIESRKIAKLSQEYIGSATPETDHDEANTLMRIDFEEGEPARVGFMMAHPETETRSADLAAQLGLNLLPPEKMGKGEIETSGFFHEASVPGVFVAGDCQTPLKNATGAIDGGARVSAGVAHALAIEEGKWARQAAEK
jgi:gliotoxin/aspirochlorine biosynthesis thioredoxin reductase